MSEDYEEEMAAFGLKMYRGSCEDVMDIPKLSLTPRTDEAIETTVQREEVVEVVPAAFARKLERELMLATIANKERGDLILQLQAECAMLMRKRETCLTGEGHAKA